MMKSMKSVIYKMVLMQDRIYTFEKCQGFKVNLRTENNERMIELSVCV